MGQVVAVGVQQAAQCLRWQVAPQLQGTRGDHFADVKQLQQHGAGFQCLVLDQGHAGVAHRARAHQIHAALHHGVFPGEELHVLAR